MSTRYLLNLLLHHEYDDLMTCYLFEFAFPSGRDEDISSHATIVERQLSPNTTGRPSDQYILTNQSGWTDEIKWLS